MEGRRRAIYIIAAAALLAAAAVYRARPGGITEMKILADGEPAGDTLELYEGTDTLLSFDISPEAFADRKVSLQAADEDIVSADEEGRVSALKQGETVLIAEAAGFRETLSVKVEDAVKDIEGIKETVTLYTGDSVKLKPKVKMASDGLEPPAVSYRSADEKTATVDKGGTVSGVAAGETTVTVTAGDISKEVKVKVNARPVIRKAKVAKKKTKKKSSGSGGSGDGGWE